MSSQFKFKRPFTPLKQVNIDFTRAVRDRLLQVNSRFRQTVLSEHFRRPSSASLQAGFSKRRSSIHFYPTDIISPADALVAAAALTPPASDLQATPTSTVPTLTHSLPSSPWCSWKEIRKIPHGDDEEEPVDDGSRQSSRRLLG